MSRSQPVWLKDRKGMEGIGVRVGDVELHPGIAGEFGYDQNVLGRSSSTDANVTNGNPVGAAVLRITPSLSLSTLTAERKEGDSGPVEPPKVNFRANLGATYREYFGKEEVSSQRNISGLANFRLEIAPQRPVGFGLYGNYERTIQASQQGLPSPESSFNHDDFGGGGELILVPGGGTLDWRFGYKYAGTRYEETSGTAYDRDQHIGYTKGRWKFRPRTALIFDGELAYSHYTHASNSTLNIYDSTPIRARLGLNGLLTSRFALMAMAGYGGSFNDTSQGGTRVGQFDSVIGQVQGTFYLTANPTAPEEGSVSLALSTFGLGFTRDFAASFYGGYNTNNRFYAQLQYSFAGRMLVTLDGGFGLIQYPDSYFAGGAQLAHAAWTDKRVDGTLFGEYRFTNTLGFNATLRYTTNISDTQLAATAGSTQVADLNWQRFEAYLGFRWFL